jgi:putative hydrolase of the HAD superfamily
VQKILLLDYDHTLYPSTLNTLKAVDDRITLYIRTFLGYTHEAADAARLQFWDQYGTTLKGLEEHHGVDREHYCDFIHAIEDCHLPPPDPSLTAWLSRMNHPFYIFTNARRDWAIRGLTAMGLASILPVSNIMDENSTLPVNDHGRLKGIFDIAFMDWQGKPHPESYAKVDTFLRLKHGQDIEIHFADDRKDNLETARMMHWNTIWVTPHNANEVPTGTFDRVLSSLSSLDPESLI